MPVLIENRSFIGVKLARLNKIIFTSFSFVFWPLFRIRNSRRLGVKFMDQHKLLILCSMALEDSNCA